MIASGLDFVLPRELEAREPAEARGLRRDEVRLLVGHGADQRVSHHVFGDLPGLLRPGDLVVVNNSATLPAALDAVPEDGTRPVVLHLSTELPDGTWVVEPRRPESGGSTQPYTVDSTPAAPGWRLRIPDGTVTFLRPYTTRLWVARFAVGAVPRYLYRHGRPIRYGYTDRDWPLSAYQNIFATVPGSAEMPSASRPFTGEVLAGLAANGIQVAPITLHTGLASPEADEAPYPERFVVPETTACRIAHTRCDGGRVIAAGTTVVRALETATDHDGVVRPRQGFTELVITPDQGVRAVDALLTGLHEPRASHLLMLEAIAGAPLLERCYAEALAHRYLWHEFGDVNLLLP
jgi:S-adenosylmethionine:tRNA ribosyltransferase-isomerase